MALGRPPSPEDGAAMVVDAIMAEKNRFSISDNELSRITGVTQSGVTRALNRKPPRMTPNLKKLKRWFDGNAIIRLNGQLTSRPKMNGRADGEAKIASIAKEMWDGTQTGLVSVISIMEAIQALLRPTRSTTTHSQEEA